MATCLSNTKKNNPQVEVSERKRSRKQSVSLNIIPERSKEEQAIKNRELVVQEKKLNLQEDSLILEQERLDLEEKKFAMEKKERTTRL